MPTILEQLTVALAGRYEIARELGAGGMATVYLARDVKHDRDVAIKVLHPDLGAVLGAERFLAEIKTTAKLQHPHILPLLDSGGAGGLLFYVMPVVSGESLRARIEREGVLPIPDAVRIAREIAGALDYAHRHGVVHRDIKPDNVLLHDGSALVADFGISLAVQTAGGQRMTQTGLSLGTPQYMSPEQAMGERNMDGRADVYALGAVAYEMLTGDPPFTGSSVQAILSKVLSERPTPVTTLRDTVPPAVADAVHKALAKLPADRFATAAQFADALVSDRPISIETRPAVPAAAQPERRRITPLLALAALNGLAVGALVTALISWRMGHARGPVSPTVPRRYSIVLPDSAPLVAGHDVFGNSRRALDLSPDGTLLVYVAGTTSGDSAATRLMLVPLNGKPATVLTGTEGASGPIFSPDGHAIAYSVGDQVLRRSLDDGATIRLGRMQAISDLAWIGERIFASGWGECVSAVAESGGELARLPTAAACRANGVAAIDSTSEWLLTANEGDLYAISKDGKMRPLSLAGAGADTSAAVAGTSPRFVPPRFVVFLRDSLLYAAPFDVKNLRFTAEPQPVLSGLRREAAYGQGHLAESSDGTAIWASGNDGSIGNFAWVDRSGRVAERLTVPPILVGGVVAAPDGRRVAINRQSASGPGSLFIADLARHVVDSVAVPIELSPLNWIRGGAGLTVVDDSGAATRSGVLHLDGPNPRIEWPKPAFDDESSSGAWQCRGALVWPAAKPADSVRFDAAGNWCRFSPDGQYVAWVKTDGLYAAAVGGQAAGRVKIAPSGADEPVWTRDGREVLYRAGRRWYSVASPAASAGDPPSPKLLFAGDYLQTPNASWSVGPDGRFLLIQASAPMRITRLEVMTGFPRFLAERLERK